MPNGDGPTWTEIGTVFVSSIALIISIITAFFRWKDNRIDIRVKIDEDVPEPPDETYSTYIIFAQNFGKRIAIIDSFRLRLKCDGKEYGYLTLTGETSKHKSGSISLPYELLPGRKLLPPITVGKYDIYRRFTDERNKEDPDGVYISPKDIMRCKLIAYFRDQLGNIYKSKPIDFKY